MDFNQKSNKDQIDAIMQGLGVNQEQAKLALDWFKAQNPNHGNPRYHNFTGDFYMDPVKPGDPRTFDWQGFSKQWNIPALSPDGKGMIIGAPYHNGQGGVVTVDADGNQVPFGGGWEGAGQYMWQKSQQPR